VNKNKTISPKINNSTTKELNEREVDVISNNELNNNKKDQLKRTCSKKSKNIKINS
jgi:F0F1-type ATP synthase delta subunit